MRKIWSIILAVFIIAGCSSDGLLDTGEQSKNELTPDEVILISGIDGLEETTAQWYVNRIGAQLLETKYRSYVESGLGESDFGRMPDNELTDNLRQLYLDLKPLM